jgi:glycosyltransferase involved in cell wall biosynthesis
LVPGAGSLRRKAGAKIEQWAYQHADHIVPLIHAAKEHIASSFSINPEKITAIPAPIDTDAVEAFMAAASGPPHATLAVVCAGRVQPRKNQMTLVQAIPEVVAEFPDVQFVFVGPIEHAAYFRRIQGYLEKNGLQRRVRFTGVLPQREFYGLYRDAAVFAFPSLGEMFARVALEALAFGLPAVVSAIPVHREILGSTAEAGILVDPNDVRGFAQGICKVLRDSTLRSSMVRSSRPIVDRYSGRQVARQTLALYERLVRLPSDATH